MLVVKNRCTVLDLLLSGASSILKIYSIDLIYIIDVDVYIVEQCTARRRMPLGRRSRRSDGAEKGGDVAEGGSFILLFFKTWYKWVIVFRRFTKLYLNKEFCTKLFCWAYHAR